METDKSMIIGLQIIAILFAFSMIYFAVLHYKRGELGGTRNRILADHVGFRNSRNNLPRTSPIVCKNLSCNQSV